MLDYLKLIRIKHWIKNILIFIPLVCSGIVIELNIVNCILGFFSFSFMTSFIYIVNDIRDIEKDKLHSKKKNRPLASGKIKKNSAIYVAAIMIILSLIINMIINKTIFHLSFIFLIFYLVINLAYSFGLKNIVIIDVVLLATGFILRVYYGASIISVEVSDWLFLTILSGSLFLGLGKRKKELSKGTAIREVLKDYNEEFLDKFQYLTLTLAIVFYSLWTIEQDIEYIYLTIPLLIVIFMKYCLFTLKNDEGDPTTILFEDKILMVLCLIYGISMLVFLLLLK